MAQDIQSKADFETLIKGEIPILVDFWASWCGPCKMMTPVLEELSKEYEDDLKIVKVNVDEQPELATAYQITSIPALKIFKGGKVLDQMVGAQPKNNMKAWIDRALA